jgi:hypothetical protein
MFNNDSNANDDVNGYFCSSIIGKGVGNVDNSLKVLRSNTGSRGNPSGTISPKTQSIFQKIRVCGKDVFIHTDGTRMPFQHKMGDNIKSLMSIFLEFILEKKVEKLEGDMFQAHDSTKAWLMEYHYKDECGKLVKQSATCIGK